MKLRKIIVSFCLMLTSVSLVSCGGSALSSKTLKGITLGMTQQEVEKKLGKPHESNDVFNEKWYYYDGSFKKKYDKVIDLLENGETEADFEKANKLYTELENMTYKCTLIKFNYDKKVTEVFYDAKHKYEESNDYATTAKTLKEVNLSISDIQYYVDESQEESSIKFANVNSSTPYEASFNDGSYIHSYVSGMNTTLDGTSAVVTWKDNISEYRVNKKANKIGTLEEDGTFNLEYAKGDLVLPYGVTEITEEMFLNNTELTSIVIPSSVKSIGKNAFQGCSSLTSIEIPSSVTSIGSSAFSGCSSLRYNEYGNCYYLGNEGNPYLVLVKAKNTSITEATISNKTRFIMNDAFLDCSSLTSIVIPDSVTSIGDHAFQDNGSLIIYCEASSQPSGWDSEWNPYDRPVYWGVTQEDIVIQNGIQYLIIDRNAVVTGRTNELPNQVVIPSSIMANGTSYSVTSIGYKAFAGCSSLTSIVIPDSVTTIGSSTFSDCSSLTSIVIPNSVTQISYCTFTNCSSLTSIVIPDSVTTIEDVAFAGCTSLTSIVIPDSVTRIRILAFAYCSSLIIYCEVSSQPSGWDSQWNYSGRPVYWAGQWSYVDGVPTPNN